MPTVEARSQSHSQWYSLALLSPARGRGQGEGATRSGSGNNQEPKPATVNSAALAATGTPRTVDTTVGDLDRQGLFGYKVRVLASLTVMESHAHH
jgi:hypothetical protein